MSSESELSISGYEPLLAAARDWARTASEAQWFSPLDLEALQSLEDRSPSTLFDPSTQRPLVAAFFGGTGAGKSTLLNRLAGQAIAKTGVERPTSREVSLYLHASISTQQLERHFSLDGIRIAQHQDDAARSILWIDMPDIDSVETQNLELVKSWLPHIDVLIYVVSPERYRDDRGWQILLEHGRDHAWVFVMNQWDRAHPLQLEAFESMLKDAHFKSPVILKTDCRERDLRASDEFETLKAILLEISNRHNLQQLEIRTEEARFEHLEVTLQKLLNRLGPEADYADLQKSWDSISQQAERDLMAGLEWPMRALVRKFVGADANPLKKSGTESQESSSRDPVHPSESLPLWDDWAMGRLQDACDRLIVEAGQKGLPMRPLKSDLDLLVGETGHRITTQAQLGLRLALARPGSLPQRLGLKIAGTLSILLPLAAMAWVAFQVTKGYYDSATLHLDYLGSDFAIHSLLLILVAWLLPFFAYTRLKPSLERTGYKGLQRAVHQTLIAIFSEAGGLLQKKDEERRAVRTAAERLQNVLPGKSSGTSTTLTGILERILPSVPR
jgi:GTPase Era involved in 16S rRNA processing